MDKKIKLNDRGYLTKGAGYNYLQNTYKFLPQMPTKKEFTSPWGNKPSYFDYSLKLKDLFGNMIPYVCICKMIRTGMFKTHSYEFLEDFYSDLTSDVYLKVTKSIHNYKPCFDLLRFVQCQTNFSWLSLWTLYKQEKKTIKGILDPQLHLSYQESLELFMTYQERGDDEQVAKILENEMKNVDGEEDSIDDLLNDETIN